MSVKFCTFFIVVQFLIVNIPSVLVGVNSGETVAQFLKVSPSARGIALGDTFVGLSNDINAIYYNPAGLRLLQKTEVTFMYNRWFEDINMQHFALGHYIRNLGTLGLSGTMLSAGNINRTDNLGNPEGTYTANDLAMSLTYSSKFPWDDTSFIGFNIKSIQQKIENESASGICFDFGLLSTYYGKRLSIGYVVQNIGTGLTFRKLKEPLPLISKIGFSWFILQNTKHSMVTLLDIRNCDNYLSAGTGMEYTLKMNEIDTSFRIGYDTKHSASNLGGVTGVTAGFGLGLKKIIYPVDISFAWQPLGDNLGNTFRISIAAKFGSIPMPEKPAPETLMQKQPVAETKTQKQPLPKTQSTNFIKGAVVDINGKPVFGALVKFFREYKEIQRFITTRTGRYQSQKLSAGVYTIKTWKKGYSSEESVVTIDTQAPTSPISRDIVLEKSPAQ